MPHVQKQLKQLTLSSKTQELVKLEHKYTAGGFKPLPAFFVEAKGSKIWDVDGKEYLDFIAMFSAVNMGHCNPYILDKVMEQIKKGIVLRRSSAKISGPHQSEAIDAISMLISSAKVTLVNLATHNATWGPLAKRLCDRLGFDKVISVVSGSEATDTATKIARKWGILKKGIAPEKTLIFGVGDSFHGLTSGVWNLQNPTKKRAEYGLDNKLQTNLNPSTGGVIRYGNIQEITECIEEHHERTAAVIIECLHGALPTHIEIEYSRAVYDLCKKYNILFIADEVRQGVGKTGKFFCHENLGVDVKPDLVALGKSISGGFYPCSYVLGKEEVMSLVGTAEVAATFGFTPIGCAATNAVLDLVDQPGYMARGPILAQKFDEAAATWKHEFILSTVSCGTDMCIYIDEDNPDYPITGRKLGALLIHKGLLVTSFTNRVRMSPPLVLTDGEMDEAMGIITEALDEVMDYDYVPGENWTGPE